MKLLELLSSIMMVMFYIIMITFIVRAFFGKPTVDEEGNLMLWAIWCLMMVNSGRRQP